ncbi:hypothetical protein PPSIR1_42191 [Plesiocystis pacifica SIR-1]|uniref:Uncharacterized protein n=2 Tax=Plesiocystis pacifica TaxID=191768 RepID=A6GCZ4_9BACT|nr:hypothetical protein PPSIR1_42191 [Plesiocystis pacifica SIR-1]
MLVLAGALALGSGLACDLQLPTGTTNAGGAANAVAKGAASASCPEWASGKMIGGSFTSDAELNADIAAFMQASADISTLADSSYKAVAKACVNMAADLGIPGDQIKPKDGDAATPACNAVSAKIGQIIKANAAVKVNYTPPSCQMDANFKAQCEAECGVEVDPGKVVAECEPARLSGYCEGTCGGRCEGTCEGSCQGECSAKDAQGNCIGECKGTCSGQCSATCHAKCTGEWKAPHCEVEVQKSQVKAECSANCEANANVRASCKPPVVDVQAQAQADAMKALTATLSKNLPALLQAQVRIGKQLSSDIKIVIASGKRLKGQMSGAGAKAVTCVGQAVNAMASASVKLNVSVKASASVSGKVGAKAGT